MKEKSRNTAFSFKKALIIYTLVLSSLMLFFLGYVVVSLIEYEKNQVEKYLDNQIKEIVAKSTNKKLEQEITNLERIKWSKFESTKTNTAEILEETLTNGSITYKQKEDSFEDDKPVYEIYVQDKKVFEITLDGTKKVSRLGLLNFSIWKIEKIENQLEEGILNYKIVIPSNTKAYVNGILVTEEEKIQKEENTALEEVAKYTDIPYNVMYEIKGLHKKPEIKVINENNQEVIYDMTDNMVLKEVEYVKIKTQEEAAKQIENIPDILKVAEDWSLYLTDDLGGTLHGYHTIKNYIMEDSELFKFAYKWATNIDITFISNHTLEKEIFTNEKVENFEVYNKNAFSCEVYLEKNMRVNGKPLQDKLHDKMYFVNQEGVWKLVNMEAITKGENKQ